MRPSTGARNSVKLRSSRAWRTAASCASTEARRRARLGALVEGLLGDGLVAHQLGGAREIRLGEREVGARLRQVGARLVERGLERPLVDGEQEVALLDHLAVGEMHLSR
jgi:hypothetical protein